MSTYEEYLFWKLFRCRDLMSIVFSFHSKGWKKFKLWQNGRLAIDFGYLEILKYQILQPYNLVYDNAILNGHLNVVKWIMSKENVYPFSSNTIGLALRSGNKDMIEYFVNGHSSEDIVKALYSITSLFRFETIEWFIENKITFDCRRILRYCSREEFYKVLLLIMSEYRLIYDQNIVDVAMTVKENVQCLNILYGLWGRLCMNFYLIIPMLYSRSKKRYPVKDCHDVHISDIFRLQSLLIWFHNHNIEIDDDILSFIYIYTYDEIKDTVRVFYPHIIDTVKSFDIENFSRKYDITIT